MVPGLENFTKGETLDRLGLLFLQRRRGDLKEVYTNNRGISRVDNQNIFSVGRGIKNKKA